MRGISTGNATGPRTGIGGFTMMELSLSMVIIVALAAVTVPMFTGVDSAKVDRAKIDCARIADALMRYAKDTRLRPTGKGGVETTNLLISARGNAPVIPAAGRQRTPLENLLFENTWSNPRWRGPYLDALPPDPWGHRYVVWAVNFHRAKPTWVLSAGPDGVLQTWPGHEKPRGDDIGVVIP